MLFSKENFKKQYNEHVEFRKGYMGSQIKTLYIINSVCLIYSMLCLGFLGKYFVKTPTYRVLEYGNMCGFSVLSAWLLSSGHYIKFKKEISRDVYFASISLISVLLYVFWGFIVMYYSILEGRNINYTPVLIVYAVCATALYFAPANYILLLLTGCGGAFFLLSNYTEKFDTGILLNIIIFGIVLTVVGERRYLSRKEIFFARKRAINLRETLEAQNEELIASNDELTGITEKLNTLLEEKEKYINQQRRFTAMLNHELRSPLNGVMGYLQLQLMNEKIPPMFKKGIKDSYSLMESMLQTVNDILDFSKMEEGKFEISKSEFRLKDVIYNIHTIFDTQAQNKGLELNYDVPDESDNSYIYSDGVRLQQIISNLTSNAIKYTDNGSVSIKAYYEGSNLCIKIQDTGKGMTEEELTLVYDPYKRFNMNRNNKVQGTGLGMTIVKSLVTALDGSINIQSKIDKGTTISIVIPIEHRTINNEKSIEKPIEQIDLSDKLFLIADDDAVSLRITQTFLKKNKASVIIAKDGEEALNVLKLKQNSINAVITDNMMPNMSGTELKEAMKKLDIIIPTVILTGSTSQEEINAYEQLGFDYILKKPLIYKELITAVNSIND